ncbi:queuine tRNA-ribosyltransferase family protein [Candidatus Pacearchaeota archaeon]|nr:queuine tRNA-ribosyltransferase family protein [Candidatus Pacearchaeota archaeon]
MKNIKLKSGKLKLPAFFPDATYGQIKGIENNEIEKLKIDGVVVNAYHLIKAGKIKEIEKGGVHKYMGIKIPVISDSGGFQVMSLIHKNSELGEITDEGVIFLLAGKRIDLTPEKCIEMQIKLGSDIIMCLDECTHSELDEKRQKKAVERTIQWAERCKKEFMRLTSKMSEKDKPKLFAIIQGGQNKKLRKKCAKELVKLDFDGYAFGGFPMKNGKLLKGILKYTAGLIPDDKLKYAMGIGKPEDIIECVKMGYDLFDCVIPTRDARHKRLFFFQNGKIQEINVRKKYFTINISKLCKCELCRNYSLEQLYEMFKNNYDKAARLATIHNLTFYSGLMRRLRVL